MVRWLLLILSTSLYHLLCIHFIFSKNFLLNKMTQTSIACLMECAVLGIEPTEEHPTYKISGSAWCGSFVGLSEIGSGTFPLTYVTRFLEIIKYFLFACVPNSLPHIISLLWNSHTLPTESQWPNWTLPEFFTYTLRHNHPTDHNSEFFTCLFIT